MPKKVLFIQGASEGAHAADAKVVERLQRALGTDYDVIYPDMPDEADPRYEDWKVAIEKELAAQPSPAIVVAHSVGGSMLLKALSEIKPKEPLAGVFLMAAPFWGGDGWRYHGYEKLQLPQDFAAALPKETPLFFYHCRDDDSVPSEHLALYAELLPAATCHQLNAGGHQFEDGLAPVAEDIKSLS
jgi:predicted alpha/beta hydrolase family esterase